MIYVNEKAPRRYAKWTNGMNSIAVFETRPSMWNQQILCPTDNPTVSECHSFIEPEDNHFCDDGPIGALNLLVEILTDWGGNGPHFPEQIKTIIPVLNQAREEIDASRN